MSTNISKFHREDLLNKIQQIRAHIASAPQDQNTGNILQYLDELTKDVKGKKYGLVFEQHREQIDEKLENNVPVLTEDKNLFIDNGGEMNFLIEGDNLAALKLLEKTHKGKIDVVYIDPPYNRGKVNDKFDFIYDDDYIDSNDTFRHSKWLSFMEKRLSAAKKLLHENGVIFISIDDNEQAQLKLLCDEVFGAENWICTICRQAIKGGSRSVNIRSVHDYVLCYGKSLQHMTHFTGEEKEELDFNLEDDKGPYLKGRELNKWGAGSRREDSPTMWFPIVGPDGEDVYPIRNDGSEGRWRWGKKKMLKAVQENDVIFERRDDGTYIVYEKVRGLKNKTKQFTTWFSDNYINAKGSESLKRIFNTLMSIFDFAKPVELIKDLCFMANNKSATILDFFAGSGTTGHAIMKLNAEDGGNRKFILCTNNENDICRDVTYQRLKTVITGKRNDGSDYSEKYDASLKYYKIDFMPISDKFYYEYADDLLKHIRELVELENGINLNGNNEIAIVLTDDEMDQFVANYSSKTKVLYRGHNVLMTDKHEDFLKSHGIRVNVIPDYYYNELNK